MGGLNLEDVASPRSPFSPGIPDSPVSPGHPCGPGGPWGQKFKSGVPAVAWCSVIRQVNTRIPNIWKKKRFLKWCMQLPEKYKANFDVSSEGPSSGVTNEGPSGQYWARYNQNKNIYYLTTCITTSVIKGCFMLIFGIFKNSSSTFKHQ
jgi:hypothetical protein